MPCMNRRQVLGLFRRLGFPSGLWFFEGFGLVATYDRRERLIEMFWSAEDLPDGRRMVLDPERRTGRVTLPEGSGGTPDHEVYQNGCAETFDAWSDALGPSPQSWRGWVRRHLGRFADGAACVLCGGRLRQAPPVAFGPDGQTYLCGSCWHRTRSEAPTERQWPLGDRFCRVCASSFGDADPLFGGRRGHLCSPCADAFERRGWRQRWPW